MNIEDFIKKVASEFEDTDVSAIKQNTKFKDLDEWSSMTVLAVMGMVNKEYQVRLRGEDFRNTSTVEDLFNLVSGRKNNV